MYNNSDFTGYVYPEPKTNWTSTENLKTSLKKVNFESRDSFSSGGIPVISNGETGYIDTSDNHVSIYGASGFKKSLVVFMVLICILAKACENMFITDPKGELYARTAKYLKSRGYKIRVFNFRDYNGEGFNPLHYPTKLYRNGYTDKALSAASEIISALAAGQEANRNIDPFWPETAKAYNNGVIPLMIDSFPKADSVNFMSLADFFTDESASIVKDFVSEHFKTSNAALTNLRTVLSEPEKTKMSTLSTCSSFIQPFIQNDKLARMISRSTCELEELTEEKTAFYVITDDTTTLCNTIVGVMISQLQTILVDKAFHSPKGKLKHRVNFICDEFCSFPIPNICEALATHRSRNIRYFLCIQSLDLLKKRYQNYKSILTNCATTLFLGSTETELLEDISNRLGKTSITASGHEEPLISVPELMTLRKAWDSKELLYFNLAEGIRYCTTLPAIEAYNAFCMGYAKLPDIHHPPVHVYTISDLMVDIELGDAKLPFEECAKDKYRRKKARRTYKTIDPEVAELQKRLDDKFEELFGEEDEE